MLAATERPLWPAATGEMAERVRALDWAATPLGPIERWPPGLRSVVDLMLAARQPAYVAWGPAHTSLYNDGYIPLLGAKHPGSLGRSYAEAWPEIWEEYRPLVAATMAGEAQYFVDRPVPLAGRPGRPLSWFTFSWTPLRDEAGAVAGFFCAATETTDHVLAVRERVRTEARQAFLLELGDALRPLADPVAIQGEAVRRLGERLRTDRAYYAEFDEHAAAFRIERDDTAAGVPGLVGRHPLAAFDWVGPTLRAGRPVVVADARAAPLIPEAARPAVAALRVGAFVAIPLVKEGRLVAALSVTEQAPRAWTPHEVELIQETAERIWATIERGRSEAAMRESEEHFRGFAENSTDTLWIIAAATGALEYLSPAFERTWGEPRTAVLREVGRWAGMVHPDDRALAAEALPGALGGATHVAEYRIVRPADGETRWIRDTGFPIRDAAGVVRRVAGIAQDVTDQKRVEAALRASEARLQERVVAATAELRALSRRLLAVQEDERRHLARELHDEVGQILTGLGLQLGTARPDEDDRLAEARRIVRDLTERVRQLSMDLRPAALDAYGLLPALRWHLERYGRQTGVAVDLRHEGLDRRLPAPVEIAAYRVVQEALTNVARHAHTHGAVVQLLADGQALTVSVRDGGHGFDPLTTTGGSGLGGMRERVDLLGGTLTVDAAPGRGVVVTAEIPTADDPPPAEEIAP